jgi:ESS family glutamate:Na+ symporter
MIFIFIILVVLSYFLSVKYLKSYIVKSPIYIPLSILIGMMGLFLIEYFAITSIKEYLLEAVTFFLCLIFSLFPVSIISSEAKLSKDIKPLWGYFALQYISQWIIAFILFYGLFKFVFANMHPHFISTLPASFAGGHGSAAVIGKVFYQLGDPSIYSLTMFMATVGLCFSILGGVAILTKLKKLENFGSPMSDNKINKRDLKILLFHSVLTTAIVYAISPLMVQLPFHIPKFVQAFILGFITLKIHKLKPKSSLSVDDYSHHITEILVIFGLSSIELAYIKLFIKPLLIYALAGLILAIVMYRYVLTRFVKYKPHAVGVFTWGWSLGGLVIGLSLFSHLDEETRNYYFPRFALAYMFVAPIEVSLLLGMPYFLNLI